jgi:hypothetical protein
VRRDGRHASARTLERIVLGRHRFGPLAKRKAVIFLLDEVARRLLAGQDIPPVVARFVASGLRKISSLETLHAPFGLRLERGETKARQRAAEKGLERAVRVGQLRLRGISHEEAVSRVARDDFLSAEAIESSWKKHKKQALQDLRLGVLWRGENLTTKQCRLLREVR